MKDNKVNGVIIGLTAKKGQVDAFASFLSNDKPTLLPPNSIPQIEKQHADQSPDTEHAVTPLDVTISSNTTSAS